MEGFEGLLPVSRHVPIAAAGIAVLLTATIMPLPEGDRDSESKFERTLARAITMPAEAPASFKDTHTTEPSIVASIEAPLGATLAGEHNAAIASTEETTAEPPSALAAIDQFIQGETEKQDHNAAAAKAMPAETKVSLATPYSSPDAPVIHAIPDVAPPAPARPEVVAPSGTDSDSLLEKVMPGDSNPAFAPLPASIAPPDADVGKLAIAAYRKGEMALGDGLTATAQTEVAHVALDWVAIRMDAYGTGFRRINTFLKAHPEWPSASWLRRRSEEALYADKQGFTLLASYFARTNPEGVLGKLALARLYRNQGKFEEARALVRDVWREGDFSQSLESKILDEFGSLLDVTDHKFRADRAFYKEEKGRLLRAAELVGGDEVVLAKAEAAVLDEAGNAEAMLAALPAKLKSDPSFTFARIHLLRRADKPEKLLEAARLMLAAPRDPALVVDGDAWWVERRLIARKLIDAGDPATAYRMCAEHSAASAEMRIEAEFHAGWIALRFLHSPTEAAPHFATVASIAAMPASIARAAYWQGRTAQALGDAAAAQAGYQQAAAYATTYYGQLARAKLNLTDLPLRETKRIAIGDERDLAIRVAEFLYAIGENDLALPLVTDAARALTDVSQMAALGKVVENGHDARAALILGKIATQRGYPLDDFAFPTFGIPYYQPVANSADQSIVYAIARQESAFAQTATSTAGAKGLMQLMPDTARRTAQHAGIALDMSKLNTDGSLNAKIGAAHLGELLSEMRGSYVLTFAAYNAGGKRVKEWMNTHGDPRRNDVDPVDWIELIPITETRDYVQRIIENMQVYRTRFGQSFPLINEAEMRRPSGG
jgi:soluble lytic murein transglycosylase